MGLGALQAGGGNKKVERIGPYEVADITRAKKLVDAFAPFSQERSLRGGHRQADKDVRKGTQGSASAQAKPFSACTRRPRAILHGTRRSRRIHRRHRVRARHRSSPRRDSVLARLVGGQPSARRRSRRTFAGTREGGLPRIFRPRPEDAGEQEGEGLAVG